MVVEVMGVMPVVVATIVLIAGIFRLVGVWVVCWVFNAVVVVGFKIVFAWSIFKLVVVVGVVTILSAFLESKVCLVFVVGWVVATAEVKLWLLVVFVCT